METILLVWLIMSAVYVVFDFKWDFCRIEIYLGSD